MKESCTRLYEPKEECSDYKVYESFKVYFRERMTWLNVEKGIRISIFIPNDVKEKWAIKITSSVRTEKVIKKPGADPAGPRGTYPKFSCGKFRVTVLFIFITNWWQTIKIFVNHLQTIKLSTLKPSLLFCLIPSQITKEKISGNFNFKGTETDFMTIPMQNFASLSNDLHFMPDHHF